MDLAARDGPRRRDAAVAAGARPAAGVAVPALRPSDRASAAGCAGPSFYAAGLFAHTLLPLPVPDELDCTGDSQVQLRPFQFLADIGYETAGLSVTGMLTARVTLQVVFNVVLFLPWGLLVRGFFKRGWVLATVTAFLGSLLIELTQYTGPWFLYPCSYRLADVDDLIMNTLGGLLGALLAPLLPAWMPSSRQVASNRSAPRRDRSPCGAAGPACCWTGSASGCSAPRRCSARCCCRVCCGSWSRRCRTPTTPPARRLCPPRTVSAGQALARAASVSGVYVVGRTAEALLPATAAGLLSLLMGLWLLVAVVSVVPTRNHRGLSCAVTGLELVDARTLAARQPRGRDAR